MRVSLVKRADVIVRFQTCSAPNFLVFGLTILKFGSAMEISEGQGDADQQV